MVSGPITLWQITGETVETADFIFGSCSHEIKRHLLLGSKVMTNLDNILKAETLLCNKGPPSQGYAFSSSHVWM